MRSEVGMWDEIPERSTPEVRIPFPFPSEFASVGGLTAWVARVFVQPTNSHPSETGRHGKQAYRSPIHGSLHVCCTSTARRLWVGCRNILNSCIGGTRA